MRASADVLRTCRQFDVADWGQMTPAPGAEADLDNACAIAVLSVANVKAEATANRSDHCVRAGGAVSVQITSLVQVVSHAVATVCRHQR